MPELALVVLSVCALLIVLVAVTFLGGLWLDPPTSEEETLPRVLVVDPATLPLHARPVPIYVPKQKAPESSVLPTEQLPAKEPATRAPIPLAKFQGRRPPPHLRLRSFVPRAELPRSSDVPCEICKGVVVVWTRDPGGGWRGLCRRCGLPFAEKVSGAAWHRPEPRHPAA